MAGWGLDLLLMALLLSLLLLLYRLSRYDVTTLDAVSDAGLADGVVASGFSLYPRKLMRQAGILPQQLRLLYWPIKLLLAVLVPLLLVDGLGTPVASLWLALAALPAFIMLDLWLLVRRARRKRRIQASLSFLIDLIVAYLDSGQSLSQAFRQAARYGLTRRNPLAREILLLARELDAGRERQAAFAALAGRTGVNDIRRLAAVMNIGLQVGSPIAPTLKVQADMLRARQVQLSTERVNRKNTEALLPMLLVSLPMFAVLILFPAGLQFYEVLQLIRSLL